MKTQKLEELFDIYIKMAKSGVPGGKHYVNLSLEIENIESQLISESGKKRDSRLINVLFANESYSSEVNIENFNDFEFSKQAGDTVFGWVGGFATDRTYLSMSVDDYKILTDYYIKRNKSL